MFVDFYFWKVIMKPAKAVKKTVRKKKDTPVKPGSTRPGGAQKALARDNSLRTLLDLSPDAVVVIDPSGSWPIIDCNAVACLMNGYTRDEMIGHSVDILNVTSGTAEERIAYMKQLREAGHLKLDTNHRRKDGVIFPVEVSTTLITINGHELVIGRVKHAGVGS